MLGFIELTAVADETEVEWIPKQAVVLGTGKRISGTGRQAEGIDRVHESVEGPRAVSVELEDLANERSTFKVRDNGEGGGVAQGSDGRHVDTSTGRRRSLAWTLPEASAQTRSWET